MTVPIERWGRDHWSVFAYAETCCVDGQGNIGRPDHRRIYCDSDRHPGRWNYWGNPRQGKYPIRLAGDELLYDYDEWDCIDDLESAGLLELLGTGINPLFRMTELGLEYAARLRQHKAHGGRYADFRIGGDKQENDA